MQSIPSGTPKANGRWRNSARCVFILHSLFFPELKRPISQQFKFDEVTAAFDAMKDGSVIKVIQSLLNVHSSPTYPPFAPTAYSCLVIDRTSVEDMEESVLPGRII